MRTEPEPPRAPVHRSYPLFVGGQFRASEAGRTYQMGPSSTARATDSDLAAAVAAAGTALGRWSSSSGHRRGQLLYRIAGLWEARGPELAALGLPMAEQPPAVDRWLWYAGWPDKLGQVFGDGSAAATAGFPADTGRCTPVPCGVAGVVIPRSAGPLALASLIAPALAAGATVVALTPPELAGAAAVLAEVVMAADLPGGTVNFLTGDVAELTPGLARHPRVAALDLAGVDDPAVAAAAAATAAERILPVRPPAAAPVDWTVEPGLDRLAGYLTGRTVWQPPTL